jgi:hypothetical protein
MLVDQRIDLAHDADRLVQGDNFRDETYIFGDRP